MSSAAFDFARRLGRLAHEAGRSILANPYDHRAVAFRSAWREEWLAAERESARPAEGRDPLEGAVG